MIEAVMGVVLLGLSAWKSREFARLGVRGLCAVAILTALSAAGRALTSGIPSVQPSSFIIMLCGATLGGGAGLFCGMLTAVLSNLMLGSLGPYTVWQMLLWGLMGLLSPKPMNANVVIRVLYGAVWGFVFGWVMNLWFPLAGFIPLNWTSLVAACVASFSFDLAHALCNAGLCLVFGGVLMGVVRRYVPVRSTRPENVPQESDRL